MGQHNGGMTQGSFTKTVQQQEQKASEIRKKIEGGDYINKRGSITALVGRKAPLKGKKNVVSQSIDTTDRVDSLLSKMGYRKASRYCLNKIYEVTNITEDVDQPCLVSVGRIETSFDLPLRVATLINRSSGSFSEFSKVVTQQAEPMFRSSRTSLFLLLPNDKSKLHATIRSIDGDHPLEVELPSDCGLPATILLSGHSIITSDTLAVPILREDCVDAIGVFIAIRDSKQPAFGPPDVVVANSFSTFISSALPLNFENNFFSILDSEPDE